MADNLRVRIEGLDVYDKRLKELDRRTSGNILRKAIREGMNVLKKEAKSRVPVRTGRLKKGIHVKVTLKKRGECYGKLGMKRKVAYGVPVELGTSRMPARPFLRPAADVKGDDAVNAFAGRLRSEIDQVTAVV